MVSVGSGPADDDPANDLPLFSDVADKQSAEELLAGEASAVEAPLPDEHRRRPPEAHGHGSQPPAHSFGSEDYGAVGYGAPDYAPGHGQVPPPQPHEAFKPYVAPPVTRRRRSDWPVLVFALVVAMLVMAGCCIAGFAVYVKHGGTL